MALTLIDNFDAGTDGSSIGSPWTQFGTPGAKEYDNVYYYSSGLSGKLRGPSSSGYAGMYYDGATLSADDEEYRWWAYFDTKNQVRQVIDSTSTTGTNSAFQIRFSSAGNIDVYTFRSGITGYAQASYTTVGTYDEDAWRQYRVKLNFTNQRYYLSKRSAIGDAWTDLKASGASDYAIPFTSSSTQSTTDALCFAGYQYVYQWIDDVYYGTDAAVTTVPLNLLRPRFIPPLVGGY